MDEKYSTTNSNLSKFQHSTTILLQNPFKIEKNQPNYLFDFLKVQCELNNKLLQNQVLLNSFISKQNIQTQKKTTSQNSEEAKNNILIPQSDKEKMPLQHQSKNKKIPRNKSRESSQEEYQPQNQVDASKTYKVSQTKNIPKNFGKAIIRFIRKNQNMTSNILNNFKMDEIKFYQMLDSYKDKINTIAQLRSLWIEQENQFAQILRILSMKYLRKHSLYHIFNSRVQNHFKHIKYRLKIMKALENPKQFTYIKDF